MCGIFGQLNPRGTSPALIERMARNQAHRGPDGYGTYTSADGQLAFGAGRLAIIDLNAGVMPIFNEDRTVAVVYNGEIYNHVALRRELEAAGHVFRTQTDTEVIVHGYEQWGTDVISRLRGMFAVGIWDEPNGRLLLARDRTGEKPLYYAPLPNGELVFASEIKALLLHPDITPAVNPDAVPHFMAVGYTPPPMTMFAGIYKLAPGKLAEVTPNGITVRYYWKPTCQPTADLSYDAAVRAVRDALTEAVEMRLMSDVPIGAFLSGGVDSTAVVALMAQALGRPVETFTVGFDFSADERNDAKFNVDRRYGKQAAEMLGTNHHEITVQMGTTLADVFPQLVVAMDEPIAQHAVVQTAYVSALARQHGVPVLLTGDAADELFLGYPHYRADRKLNQYLRVPRLLRTGVFDPLLRRTGRDSLVKLADKSTHDEGWARRYLAWMRVNGVDNLTQLMQDKTLAQHGADNVYSPICALLNMPQTPHFADRIAYTSFRRWVAEDSNMRVDKMSMLMSVEARAPFQDHELVNLAFSLPMPYKLRDGDFKRVLKDAVRGLVPEDVLTRPKWGFAPPSSDWLRGALAPLVEQYLNAEHVNAVGWFDGKTVAELVAAHHEKRGYHLWTLYPLLVFHIWHAAYIEGTLTFDAPLNAGTLVGTLVED
jgi:asparagine synthase (glutamine-hydrolysing)